MNPMIRSAEARLRRVYAGEYLLDVYPQLLGTLQEKAIAQAEWERGMDEATLARAWIEMMEVRPDRVAIKS